MQITIDKPKTIQEIAIAYTGSVAWVPSLKSINKLTSDLLFAGQKIIVPDASLTAQMKASLVGNSLIENARKYALIGGIVLAAGFAFWFIKGRK